jgi:GTP:adenosylcobinamide-phosphate guanylyltransferase
MDLRELFESMHAGRDLTRHHLRGTYCKPQIAALWNQHIRTWKLAKATAERQIAEFDSNDFGYITDVDRLIENILDTGLSTPTDTVTMTREEFRTIADDVELIYAGLRKTNREFDVDHIIHVALGLRAIVAQHMPKESS